MIELALELFMAVFRSASAGDIVCLWSLWKSSRGLQLAIAFFCVVWFGRFDSVVLRARCFCGFPRPRE